MMGIARYAHCCNISMNVMQVITLYLIRFLELLHKWELMLCTIKTGQESMAGEVIAAQREPTTLVLLGRDFGVKLSFQSKSYLYSHELVKL